MICPSTAISALGLKYSLVNPAACAQCGHTRALPPAPTKLSYSSPTALPCPQLKSPGCRLSTSRTPSRSTNRVTDAPLVCIPVASLSAMDTACKSLVNWERCTTIGLDSDESDAALVFGLPIIADANKPKPITAETMNFLFASYSLAFSRLAPLQTIEEVES